MLRCPLICFFPHTKRSLPLALGVIISSSFMFMRTIIIKAMQLKNIHCFRSCEQLLKPHMNLWNHPAMSEKGNTQSVLNQFYLYYDKLFCKTNPTNKLSYFHGELSSTAVKRHKCKRLPLDGIILLILCISTKHNKKWIWKSEWWYIRTTTNDIYKYHCHDSNLF